MRLDPGLLRAGVAAVALWAFAGCQTGTSLWVEVDVTGAPAQQLHVVGYSGAALVFGPAVRPEHAGESLVGTQSLRVLLPDSLAGETVRVRVSALVNGQATGFGEAVVVPERGGEVVAKVGLTLSSSRCPGCAGCCDATDTCVAPSRERCGGGGVSCFPCPPSLADGCGNGACTCGGGPACDPVRADVCLNGSCRCGGSAACAPGSECVDGQCRCTASSCLGCCAQNQCLPGTANQACGTGGAACTQCGSGTSCRAPGVCGS